MSCRGKRKRLSPVELEEGSRKQTRERTIAEAGSDVERDEVGGRVVT
jgi:hypothetical protein